MNQAKKALLQQIYDFQQNSSEPFSISTNHVSQYDVAYLKQNGFIVETLPQLNRYNLILTAKGESFVENGFSSALPPASVNNSFDFSSASFNNSVVGSGIHDVNYSFNAGVPFKELRELIGSKPAADQEQLKELLSVLQDIDQSDQPVNKGILIRFSDLLQKYSDLIVPVGKILLGIFSGGLQ